MRFSAASSPAAGWAYHGVELTTPSERLAALGARTEQRTPAYQYILALLVAVSGGALGIIGAIIQEFQASPAFLLGPFVAAPIIEEAMKPVGVYIALIRWPLALRSQTFTAVLAALAGLVFGIIESIVYVTIYVDDPSDTFVAYRFSVTLGLHAAASYLVGLGINQGVLDWAQGRSPLPRASRNFYFAGVILHSLYNTTVVILAISGITDFD